MVSLCWFTPIPLDIMALWVFPPVATHWSVVLISILWGHAELDVMSRNGSVSTQDQLRPITYSTACVRSCDGPQYSYRNHDRVWLCVFLETRFVYCKDLMMHTCPSVVYGRNWMVIFEIDPLPLYITIQDRKPSPNADGVYWQEHIRALIASIQRGLITIIIYSNRCGWISVCHFSGVTFSTEMSVNKCTPFCIILFP